MMKYIKAIFNMDDWSVLGKLIHRSVVTDPQNAWLPIFTIHGIINVTGLMARRVVAQAGGASTMQFRHDTVPSILDDGTLAITGDLADTLYTCQGDPTSPILSGLGIIPGAIAPFLMAMDGNIEVTMTAAAGTGSTEYWLSYIPIRNGYVVPA